MFEHDKWGNLSNTTFGNGEQQWRNPNKVGSLFESPDRNDRKYDAGGRLKESRHATYKYDEEGFLIEKKLKNGQRWRYKWNAAGMLLAVQRPDKLEVHYAYDALGRRIEKSFGTAITHYLWKGNTPLHEWKTFNFRETTADDLITWIFEQDSFIPAGKIRNDKKYSLICDHLGTPIQGYNEEGSLIWERELDSYGKPRMLKGEEGFCNYTYQGQMYDPEAGLCYNRFRYYSPEEGIYISQDPIGLAGNNPTLYGYVPDTNNGVDIFGLYGDSALQALKDIENGATDITVKSHAEAKTLLYHMQLKDGYTSSQGLNSTAARDFYKGQPYYHWDTEWEWSSENGRAILSNHDSTHVGGHAFEPHLQFHPVKGKVIRVRWDGAIIPESEAGVIAANGCH